MRLPRVGLIPKILLLSSSLLLLPWLGYQFIDEMEHYLQTGQENTLIGTTQALATALHERPALFNQHASFLKQVKKGRDLYAYPLDDAINLDGFLDDWQQYKHRFLHYGENKVLYQRNPNQKVALSFSNMVGKHGNYLYAMFSVTDPNPIKRATNALRIDQNDMLIMALETPEGEYKRYGVAVTRDGWFNAFTVPVSLSAVSGIEVEPSIQGHWRTTSKGYDIELRLPLDMLGSKLSFAFQDVNNTGSRRVDAVVATAPYRQSDKMGSVLVPSPEIERIIKGMQHNPSRIWVVDRHQRVLARSGDIHSSGGLWNQNDKTVEHQEGWWNTLYYARIAPLLDAWLNRPSNDFVDTLNDSTQLNSDYIEKALLGASQTHWRFTSDQKAVILSAASPIFVDGKVMGAVVAEQTTNGIRSLRNTAMQTLFQTLSLIIAAVVVLLLAFTAGISWRIRGLRNQTESAIDDKGKVNHLIEPSTRRDEIGDLSRSFSLVLERLAGYNQYLEKLSSRLSHELRTPVAVVRSSLENMSDDAPLSPHQQKAFARAQEGINRLNLILNSMTEASRIEQSLKSMELEPIVLQELLDGYHQSYALIYPNHRFTLSMDEQAATLEGVPEYLGQLLDKLVGNAVDFSEPNEPIKITLSHQKQQATITLANKGPLLPEEMKEQVFDSMVSLRTKKSDKPHLGLGLYIAKLIAHYHNGRISIQNQASQDGVIVTLVLPLTSSHQAD
ncbi:proteobacterial dedicated sortase system histidine kinase [Paraferrimonas haliotis]|uniref:proteobacterial dedicated sortase system histidine kinase n=1 Tax=Paraferrimonas haliotis TaxID=2013866 RepID=UPI000BA961F6|nr:proteobacterial dedicated sortase system histidine kinase [Paraferrimonas haliotis]